MANDSFRAWHLRVQTVAGERMLSRALQVLGTQLIDPSMAQISKLGSLAQIDLLVETDASKARRVGLLLRRLDRVRSSSWYAVSVTDAEEFMQKAVTATRVDTRLQPTLDVDSDFWRSAASVFMNRDAYGNLVHGNNTEVRFAWNEESLFMLFLCDYQHLNQRTTRPVLDNPTDELWNNDVAEIFISAGSTTPVQYKEFEVSPRGEWVALNIETHEDGDPKGTALQCNAKFAAELAHAARQWRGMIEIPFDALGCEVPEAGMEFRVNLFRSQGPEPVEIAWRPTHHVSFHVPSSFGTLVLVEE